MICDFAETYHIFNYRELPVKLLVTLFIGLRADSRIKMKVSGMKVPINTILLASISDKLSVWLYANSKDAKRGVNKPKMILNELLAEDNDLQSFTDSDTFERRRAEILKQLEGRD